MNLWLTDSEEFEISGEDVLASVPGAVSAWPPLVQHGPKTAMDAAFGDLIHDSLRYMYAPHFGGTSDMLGLSAILNRPEADSTT